MSRGAVLDAMFFGLSALLVIGGLILLLRRSLRSWRFGVFFESERWEDEGGDEDGAKGEAG